MGQKNRRVGDDGGSRSATSAPWRERPAREWCAWEDAHVSPAPRHRPDPRHEDAEFRPRFARVVTHYRRKPAFLEDDQLLRDAPSLNGVRGVLIRGRYDVAIVERAGAVRRELADA